MAAGASNPVLYYTFENGTGTTVTDRSNAGNNLDGGFTGDWDSTDKKRGSYSAYFGAGEAVGNGKPSPDSDSIGDLTTFAFIHQTRVWTISTWLRPSNTSYRAICGNTASNIHGVCLFYSGGIRVHFGSTYYDFSDTALSIDTWHHVLVTASGGGPGKVKCYINGILKDTVTSAYATTGNSTNTWVVGNTGYSTGIWTGSSFLGEMDEYSIWDVVFTADDVANIYNEGSPYDVSGGLDRDRGESAVKKIDGIAAASIKSFLGVAAAEAGLIKNTMGILAPSAWGFTNVNSIVVDGSNEYLYTADHADFNFNYNSAFSLSAWVKTSSGGWRGIINKAITSSYNGPFTGWVFGQTAGNLFCDLSSHWGSGLAMAAKTTGVNVTDGIWYHVVVTFSGSGTLAGTMFYVDGVAKSPVIHAYNALGTNSIQNSEPVRIGNMPLNGIGDTWWNGGIDEVSVWNKELSSAEVGDIYNSGLPNNLKIHSAESDLISWWRMGDGSGDSSDSSDGGARIYDQSGNGHNLTPVNTEAADITTDVPE